MSLSNAFIRGVCVFLGVLLTATPLASAAVEAPAPSSDEAIVKRILGHWQERQKRFQSIHAKWESRVFTGMRAASPSSRFLNEFWADDEGRFRFNEWSERPVGPQASKLDSSLPSRGAPARQWSFNGKTCRTFDGDPPQGQVTGRGGFSVPYYGVLPLMLAIRPVSRDGPFNVVSGRFEVESRNAIIGSTHCLKLHEELGDDASYWVDPNRDDVIVAWESLLVRRLQIFVTIDYRRDPKYGWLPIGWTQTSPRPSQLARFENTVIRLAINEHIAEPTFTLEFPAGTNVFDRMTHERYLIENDHTKTIVAKWDAESQRVAETLEFPACFKIDSEPLKDALERIGRQYEFKIVIDPAVIRTGIDPAMKVALNTCRVPLRDVLTALLKQAPKPLVYRAEHGALTILPAPRTK